MNEEFRKNAGRSEHEVVHLVVGALISGGAAMAAYGDAVDPFLGLTCVLFGFVVMLHPFWMRNLS